MLEKSKGNSVVKSLSVTRWAARADACRSLQKNYKNIYEVLTTIADDISEKPVTRTEAEGIIRHLDRFETAFLTTMWATLMERFYAVQIRLQSTDICLNEVIDLYDSLSKFVSSLRDMFDYYESEAAKISLTSDIEYDTSSKRKRFRKLQPDETREGEVLLQGRDKFRVETYLTILDKIDVELTKRCTGYKETFERFKILECLY